jgi:hypothetical protein
MGSSERGWLARPGERPPFDHVVDSSREHRIRRSEDRIAPIGLA